MAQKKNLFLTTAYTVKSNIAVKGYEIHIGKTIGPDCDCAWLRVSGGTEGAMSSDGRVRGCYLHGLFASDGFRAEILDELGTTSQMASYDTTVNETLDQLAIFIEQHFDIEGLMALAADITKN